MKPWSLATNIILLFCCGRSRDIWSRTHHFLHPAKCLLWEWVVSQKCFLCWLLELQDSCKELLHGNHMINSWLHTCWLKMPPVCSTNVVHCPFKRKAPGPDNLISEHLLEGGVAVIKWLTHAYLQCNSQPWGSHWNVAHLFPYKKEGSTVREAPLISRKHFCQIYQKSLTSLSKSITIYCKGYLVCRCYLSYAGTWKMEVVIHVPL